MTELRFTSFCPRGTEPNSMSITQYFYGSLPYNLALALQNQIKENVSQGIEIGHVIGCEHPLVITAGRSCEAKIGKSDGESALEIVSTDRGGKLTLHSPGQLVIYPILHLPSFGLRVKSYIELLKSTTCEWLHRLGLHEVSSEEVGVFLPQGKVASMGVRVNQGIATHGISININNDTQYFSMIPVCGSYATRVTSLSEVLGGQSFCLDPLFASWVDIFKQKLH